MKAAPFGFGRPLRWLVLLLCAGGVALAAENTWISSLRVGDVTLSEWLERLTSDDTVPSEIPSAEAFAKARESSHAIDRWIKPALFSQPASGWTFGGKKSLSAPVIETQRAPLPVVVQTSYSLPPAFFSSGGVSYSNSAFGPFPNVPDGGPPQGPGFWISNASGNWSNAANWKDGVIPSGANEVAHLDTLNITTDVTVTLDSSRLLGELYVGDTNGTHRYEIAPGSTGQRFIFDSGTGTSLLTQDSTSAGDTISVPIFLNSDLVISNESTTHPFRISGDIVSNRASPTVSQLSFAGTVYASGNIGPGSSGGDLALNIGGNVTLSGTNSYGGNTFVTGALFVNGDNAPADGLVQVAGGGSLLGGTGTVGGIVTIHGGTITGGETTTVGTLTLLQSLSISTTQGGGGNYLANLDGTTSDLLKITGTLNIGSGTTLDIQGSADGTSTYILATFLGGGLTGEFQFVTGLPADYELVYTSSNIQLVPIPEPATWIGGVLTLGAIAFASRRKLIRRR